MRKPIRQSCFVDVMLFAIGLVAPLACQVCAGADARPGADAESLEKLIADVSAPGLIHSAIGVTAKGAPIACMIHRDDLDVHANRTRVLLVAGLDGRTEQTRRVLAAVKWFYTAPQADELRKRFIVSAVPCARPDAPGAAPPDPTGGFPPRGGAYDSKADPDANYLWRWIGMHAPDVVIVFSAKTPKWTFVHAAAALPAPRTPQKPGSLALWSALATHAPANVGSVNAAAAQLDSDAGPALAGVLGMIPADAVIPSPARVELQHRLDRTPVEVARQLAQRYGHDLNSVFYIPSLALVGRLSLGDLTGDAAVLAEVQRIVEPYAAGRKATMNDKPSAPIVAGHLVFAALAGRSDIPAYRDLVRRAADVAFDAEGKPLAAMPNHSQMSDSVFMACPVLAEAGRLTADAKYVDMCVRHLRFMRKLCLRGDGLYRHSPLDEAAWGRGNGFPALGLALSLSAMPADAPSRDEVLADYRAHLDALAQHQDATGAWHQVIDRPESYRELTATCMISFAIARGLRRGWLPRDRFEPVLDRAWTAIRLRVAPDASLVDVCTGTGKQKSLRDYYDRPAILGPDGRGGAMALLAATEIAHWQRER